MRASALFQVVLVGLAPWAARPAQASEHGPTLGAAVTGSLLSSGTPASRGSGDEHPAQVLINQVGYLPGLSKIATVRSESNQPLPWRLLNAAGHKVAAGKTEVAGKDALAGDSVHVVDFSSYQREGHGLTIEVGKARSHPFDIDAHVYRRLKYDSLSYFYHNRSGVEIAMPYAGGEQWTRPAGHLSDKSVPCAPAAPCSYRVDASGGWYDAGDHGKYVVNAGISVWTLLNFFERAKAAGAPMTDFADGSMNIPERGNGVPDLLDEARFELDFMLRMQVPEGHPLAGMAHHKIHDEKWTGLGLAPHEDPQRRLVFPPSTAATLNLAAVAAQAARIWQGIDPGFSARCLVAAERAWRAAQKNPSLYALAGGEGGGPYEDKQVDDELYWATAELFVTTGKPEYQKALAASPYYLKLAPRVGPPDEVGITAPMTWQATAGMGTISLALVSNKLPPADLAAARAAVVQAADTYLAVQRARGYRVPLDYGRTGQAPWGSTSFLLDNLVVLGLAYDFTGQPKYLNAVGTGMDYILGRNPMDQCYVTGYGAKPLRNPHHRFWSRQANDKYPSAPPGAVSGGPNSGLQDPYVRERLAGCAPEKCFADHIESWSTNEIAINWNAPLAWVAAFLDEKGSAEQARRQ